MIYCVSNGNVFYLIIFYYFYSIVRFVVSSCVGMKYVKFFFWSCEFIGVYVIFVFSVGFNLIIDECFVFGNGIDV